jgi:c-di-GMP-binding flagellar brake protein YcgR
MRKNKVKDKGGKGRERRKEPRIKVEARVKIRLKTGQSEGPNQARKEELWAFTSELSVGGFRLLLPLKLEQGKQADIELYLPDLNKVLRIEAEVRWQQPSFVGGLYETGFEFKTLSAEDKISLMEFLYLHRAKKEAKGGKL